MYCGLGRAARRKRLVPVVCQPKAGHCRRCLRLQIARKLGLGRRCWAGNNAQAVNSVAQADIDRKAALIAVKNNGTLRHLLLIFMAFTPVAGLNKSARTLPERCCPKYFLSGCKLDYIDATLLESDSLVFAG